MSTLCLEFASTTLEAYQKSVSTLSNMMAENGLLIMAVRNFIIDT